MKYGELKKELVDYEIEKCDFDTLALVVEVLKSKKEKFEYFIKERNVLNDDDFLDLYMDYFFINHEEIYNEYYAYRFLSPKRVKIMVDEFVKSGYLCRDILCSGYKKCKYEVVCDEMFNLNQTKEYSKAELEKLVDDGKVIITKPHIVYGELYTELPREVGIAERNIKLTPMVLSDKDITKFIRSEMSTENVKRAYNEYCEIYDNYKQKILARLKELKNQKQSEIKEIDSAIERTGRC